uniref:Uncharacterized protein n=1 Tax=Fagus sylvatica TaxID=28930 RepID=A0A2N9F579_FAGSY
MPRDHQSAPYRDGGIVSSSLTTPNHPEPTSPRTTPPPRAGLEISRSPIWRSQAVTHLEPKKLANGQISRTGKSGDPSGVPPERANDSREGRISRTVADLVSSSWRSLAPSPIWYQAHIWRSLSPSSRSLRRGA